MPFSFLPEKNNILSFCVRVRSYLRNICVFTSMLQVTHKSCQVELTSGYHKKSPVKRRLNRVRRSRIGNIAGVICILLCSVIGAEAQEFTTSYAVVQYDNIKQLQRLNNNLFLSREMSFELRKREIITVQDEIAAKVDIIIEKAQKVSAMRPPNFHFTIRLFSSAKDAQTALFKRYNKKVKYISFYSRRDNLLYLSVRDADLHVVAHEFGHVVVEHYFNRAPPVQMHEVMAQYVETHITD